MPLTENSRTKGSAPARPGLRLREEIQPGVPRFTGFTHGQEPVGKVWPGTIGLSSGRLRKETL